MSYAKSEVFCNRQETLYYYKQALELEREHKGVKHLGALLLDSSLISATKSDGKKKYTIKIINCGKYKYIYSYENYLKCKDKNLIKKIDTDNLINIKKDIIIKEKKESKKELKEIDNKNINRSKFNLQRLIKCNEDIFHTFITLTFKEDIYNIDLANKYFHNFVTMTKRKFKEFKYICVPEFQKNGKVHYHLLTNIYYSDILLINENINHLYLLNKIKYIKLCKNNKKILIDKELKLNDTICYRLQDNKLENTKKTYNYKSKQCKIFKTLKYWNYGYSNVISLKNINIVGYMTKYMIKDIDNRLYGKKRYMYSSGLALPYVDYIDLKNIEHMRYLFNIYDNYENVFDSHYFDIYNNIVKFNEFKEKC